VGQAIVFRGLEFSMVSCAARQIFNFKKKARQFMKIIEEFRSASVNAAAVAAAHRVLGQLLPGHGADRLARR